MIVGFNDLQFTIVLGKVFLDVSCCLIVHDVQFWFEALSCQLIKLCGVCVGKKTDKFPLPVMLPTGPVSVFVLVL
jgi:hypothetical protein